MLKMTSVNVEKTTALLCLDYANSLLWHASGCPKETLFSYADLLGWCEKEGSLSREQAKNLLSKAKKDSEEAEQAFRRAIAFREVVYRIFSEISHKESPSDADLIQLNEALQQATSSTRIIKTGTEFIWDWNMRKDSLDIPIYPIVLSTAELLVSEECSRIGQCADDRGCGWLFLDTSKNHSRRWCDINDCGNRAKQRRHYEKTQKKRKTTKSLSE